MLGLTPLGLVHTAVSLVALAAGFWALVRHHEIDPRTRLGFTSLAATAITAATALMIFQRGSFGIGHKIAVATLVVLAVGTLATRTNVFGGASRYVRATCFSLTMPLQIVPGSAETLTRLPPGAPLMNAANAYLFQYFIDGVAALFLIGLAIQLLWLRRRV